jgi:ubiquinone biosynthesis protein
MRYDLLPTEYCRELSALLDRLPPSPGAAIMATIEAEFSKPVEELFRSFDPVPLSSATVAQVHKAVTQDGKDVVVKVKHPGIGLRYWVDLTNLRLAAGLASFVGFFRDFDIQAMVREFARLAEEELDFRHEARNIYVMHELLASDDIDHYAPAVYPELCGPSVITMERLEGVWMTEFLSAIDTRDFERIDAWNTVGITAERTSRLLLRSILEQCFTHRMFHADPHAGNLVILKGGTLGYVDFGMVGWLDEKVWQQQYKLNEALAAGRIHLAYEAILDMLEPLKEKDLADFEMEVKALLKEWLFAAKVPGTSIQEQSNAALFLRLFEILRCEGLSMSLGSMRLIRALMESDVICLHLNPGLSRLDELRAYFDERLEKEFYGTLLSQLSPKTVYSLVSGIASAFRTAPKVLEWLYRRLPQLGRQYQDEASAFEQAAGLAFRYLQVAAFLGMLAVLFGRIIAVPFIPDSAWAESIDYLGPYWWAVGAGMAILGMMLGAIRNKFP